MRTVDDLSRLDRTTLRAWRIANIVGWLLVGIAIAYAVPVILTRTIVQRIAYETVGWQAAATSIAIAVLAAATAGWTVGRHVYRWPVLVTLAAVLFPVGLFVVLFAVRHPTAETAITLAWAVVPAAAATIAARLAWRRRPSALRASR
jgi:hypothetical protein